MEHAVTRVLRAPATPEGRHSPGGAHHLRAMGCGCGALSRWDRNRGSSLCRGWAGRARDAARPAAAAEQAYAARQPLWIADTEGVLGFPLLLGGEVLGAMAFAGATSAPTSS